jgi:hypothetical protein
MTEQRLRELVEIWQARLGLEKWDIHLEVGGADDDCSAMTQRSHAYDTATIRVQPWLAGQAPLPTDWPGRPWDDSDRRRNELLAAEGHLLDTLIAALDAGASLRQVAPLIGVSPSTLLRRVGKRGPGEDPLDRTAPEETPCA